jgi:hypothetical protein
MRCANGECSPGLFVAASSNLLTSGFDVPRLEMTEMGPGQYTYNTPDDAVFVMCAEFRCLPEFEGANHEIANFDTCVVAYDTFTGDEPLVEVEALAATPPQLAVPCEGEPLEVLARPRTEGAWFGCWAYGETEIIRASRLAALSDESADILSDCGECAAFSKYCDPFAPRPANTHRFAFAECRASTLQVGVCVQDECRRWCRDDDDCRGPIQGCPPEAEFCLPPTSKCLPLLGACEDDGSRGPVRISAPDG